MIHSTTSCVATIDDDPDESVRAGEAETPFLEPFPMARYHREPLPRAKPEERLTHGLCPEDFFGFCAQEIDDEFMESLRVIRQRA